MKRKKKLAIIAFLMLVEVTSIFLVCKSNSDNKTILDDVSLQENDALSNDMFAIMLEQEDGTYKESDDNTWPTNDTYVYDITKSGCMDENGDKIENALEYDLVNNIANVETGNTSYCYLYFSKPINLYELCEGTENMSDCLGQKEEQVYMVNNVTDEITGGMYRYQGTYEEVQDNYICFGVSTIEDCIGSEYKEGIYDETKFSNYLYRIIGVTPDGNLKLLKKEALETAQQWHSSRDDDISWNNSSLNLNLNGELFVDNLSYVPSGWSEKISDYDWKYGDIISGNSGIDQLGLDLYETENSWKDYLTSKIGLLYIHDYYLSVSNSINCNIDIEPCTLGWLNLSNNDATNIEFSLFLPTSEPPSSYEWTMSRYGEYNSYFVTWRIAPNGSIHYQYTNAKQSVRPVFYLTTDIKILSGDGTMINPYLIG